MTTDHNMRPPDHADRAIYIVDDDLMVRDALQFSFETAGYKPRSFETAQDFLSELECLREGCVVLDLRMPETDGIEVLKQMGGRARQFPVVVITGHGDVSDAVAAMKLGAADFLEKPFMDEELFLVIDGIFRKRHETTIRQATNEAERRKFARLTPRETEVVQGIVDGLPSKLIAFRLGISTRTVEHHRSSLMDRLELKSLAELVRLALLAGMEPTGDGAGTRK